MARIDDLIRPTKTGPVNSHGERAEPVREGERRTKSGGREVESENVSEGGKRWSDQTAPIHLTRCF